MTTPAHASPPPTRLTYSQDEEDLRERLRDLLGKRCPPSQVVAGLERPEPFDAKLWHAIAVELGLAGLAVPERFGGAGASWREAAAVLEELGRAVAPVPYLTSSVAAAALLECAQTSDPAARLLRRLASGEVVVTLAVPLSTPPWGPPADAPPAGVSADGSHVRGQVTSVADAMAADVLLVPAPGGLYEVAADACGVHRESVTSLDLTRRLGDLTFDAAPAALLATDATGVVTRALLVGAALLASEQLGVASWCLDTTVAYLKTRHQFGRPVGGFQALKHRLADVWVDLTQARATARYAAGCAAEGDPDLAVAACVAQAFCSPMAVQAAQECVQLHGGIGFTWEHPAHLYLKRANAAALSFGSAAAHRSHLAGLVGLPAT